MDDAIKIIYAKASEKIMEIHQFLVKCNKIAVLSSNEETDMFLETFDPSYLYLPAIRVLRNEITASLKLLDDLVNNNYEMHENDDDGFFRREHCDWIEQELQFQLDYFDLLTRLNIEIDRKYRETTIGNYTIYLLHEKNYRKAKIFIEYALDHTYPSNNKINYEDWYRKLK